MIRKIALKDVPKKGTSIYKNAIQSEIQQFVTEQWEAAEVDTTKYKSPLVANSVYRVAIKRSGFNTVRAILRGGKVFLVRKEGDN